MDLRKVRKKKARKAVGVERPDLGAPAPAPAPASPPAPAPAAAPVVAAGPALEAVETPLAMPEAQDPGWPEMRDADDARPAVWGRDEEDEALVTAARERSEIAEMLIEAAQRRGEIADELVRQAQERGEIAEMLIKAAQRRSEIVDARERQVAAREEAVAALERDAAERGAIVNARDKAAVERDAIVNARDKAAVERDAIANARDKAAVERDAIANARDKTAAERESLRPGLPAPSRETEVEPDDAELEKARLEAQLQRAHLDALTGAYRREMGRLALRNEIDRARRGDGHFVIAFIDVDGLKGVNDRDGHAAGDRILRTLVATMRANLRSYDPIVRFGGDEFILGISSIDPEEAQHRIGVIDQSLRSATGVGITAGLASLDQGDSLEELTARADAALIEAKRNRNN